jgi:hypothetical protein
MGGEVAGEKRDFSAPDVSGNPIPCSPARSLVTLPTELRYKQANVLKRNVLMQKKKLP